MPLQHTPNFNAGSFTLVAAKPNALLKTIPLLPIAKQDKFEGSQVKEWFASFHPEAWKRLWAWTDMAMPHEVSGLGIVKLLKTGVLYIPEVFLCEQVNSSGHTELEANDIADLQLRLMREAQEGKREEVDAEQILLWWHSHNSMAAYFSGTDTGTIKKLDAEPFLFSLVVNSNREYQARVDIHKPFVTAWPVTIAPDWTLTPEEIKEYSEIFSEKCKTKEWLSVRDTDRWRDTEAWMGAYQSYQGSGYRGLPIGGQEAVLVKQDTPERVSALRTPPAAWTLVQQAAYWACRYDLSMVQGSIVVLLRLYCAAGKEAIPHESRLLNLVINDKLATDLSEDVQYVYASLVDFLENDNYVSSLREAAEDAPSFFELLFAFEEGFVSEDGVMTNAGDLVEKSTKVAKAPKKLKKSKNAPKNGAAAFSSPGLDPTDSVDLLE